MSTQPTSNELAATRTSLADLRSHLANERTHLAYMRTCVSLIGFGITLNRFAVFLQQNDKLQAGQTFGAMHDTQNVGMGMVVLGIVLACWSIYRYKRVNNDIRNARFRPMDRAVVTMTLVFLLIGCVTAAWLFRV
jgi:putative membrane protein